VHPAELESVRPRGCVLHARSQRSGRAVGFEAECDLQQRDRRTGGPRLRLRKPSGTQRYLRAGTHNRHVARSIAEDLLGLPEPPTAIFAASDIQALGVLEGARGLGLNVPGDLSVIGFDDIEVASYAGLTTIRWPLFQSGHRGCELLLQALAGEAIAVRTETMPLELVARGTTAPPKTA